MRKILLTTGAALLSGAALAQSVSGPTAAHPGKTFTFATWQNWTPDPGFTGAWVALASGGGGGGGGGTIAAGQSGSGGAGGGQATYINFVYLTAAQIISAETSGSVSITVGAGGAGGAAGGNGGAGGNSLFGTGAQQIMAAFGPGGGGYGSQGAASAGGNSGGGASGGGSSNGATIGSLGVFYSQLGGIGVVGAPPEVGYPYIIGGSGNGASATGVVNSLSSLCYGSGGVSGGGANAGTFTAGASPVTVSYSVNGGAATGGNGSDGGNAYSSLATWPFACLPSGGGGGGGNAAGVGGAGGSGAFPGGPGAGGGSGTGGGGPGGNGGGGEVVIVETF